MASRNTGSRKHGPKKGNARGKNKLAFYNEKNESSSKPTQRIGFRNSLSNPQGLEINIGPQMKKDENQNKESIKATSYRQSAGRRNAFDLGSFGQTGPDVKGARKIVWKRQANSRDPCECERPTSQPMEAVPEKGEEANAQATLKRLNVDEDSDKELTPRSQASSKERTKLTLGPEKMELTPIQKKAFREVFDLFDCNGGGTIDANELDVTLRTVNIKLTKDEIYQVLGTIDGDGNGEIDFDEFLELMTNTERFIEAMAPVDVNHTARENLLFDALTEFMKKSALKSMDEIVGYYSTKYRKFQKPHVVTHYAAGARLIGLTEKQLKEHIETIKADNAATEGLNQSPYAKPLHIITSSMNVVPFALNASRGRPPRQKHKGRMLTIPVSFHRPPNMPLHHVYVEDRGYGWVNQRCDNVAVHLPPSHFKELMPTDSLTTEDIPAIRKNTGLPEKHDDASQAGLPDLDENLSIHSHDSESLISDNETQITQSKGKASLKHPAKSSANKSNKPIEINDSDGEKTVLNKTNDNKKDAKQVKPVFHSKPPKTKTSKGQVELIDVMTKAFRKDADSSEKIALQELDDVSIFTEHIARDLRAIKEYEQRKIVEHQITDTIFKFQMDRWRRQKMVDPNEDDYATPYNIEDDDDIYVPPTQASQSVRPTVAGKRPRSTHTGPLPHTPSFKDVNSTSSRKTLGTKHPRTTHSVTTIGRKTFAPMKNVTHEKIVSNQHGTHMQLSHKTSGRSSMHSPTGSTHSVEEIAYDAI